MGFSDLTSNLLTVPIYISAGFSNILFALHSDYRQERGYHTAFGFCVSGAGFGILFCVYISDSDIVQLAYFAAVLAACGCYPCITVILAWLTDYLGFEKSLLNKQQQEKKENNEVVGEEERKAAVKAATGTAMVISFANSGGFFGPQAFGLCKDHTGEYTFAFLGISILFLFGIICCVVLKWHLKKKVDSYKLFVNEVELTDENEKMSLLMFNNSETKTGVGS